MRTLSTAWTHVRRSPYQAFAAILTMLLSFLLVGIFFLTTLASMFILKYFESKPQITVFFTDKANIQEAQTLEQTLKATGKVASVKYVSKEEALTIYREQNKNDPLLLEMVTADILPASLEVSATQPQYLKELEPLIKQAVGVEEVVYQKEVVDTLLSWTYAVRRAGLVLASLLAINSILIIMTVIGMKIAMKKDEIDILLLLGASPWYVRGPFVIEGAAYGVLGAFVAWTLMAGLILWLRPFILAFLGIVPLIHTVMVNPLSSAFLLSLFGYLGLLLATGVLLGSVGSLVALGRYLKF